MKKIFLAAFLMLLLGGCASESLTPELKGQPMRPINNSIEEKPFVSNKDFKNEE